MRDMENMEIYENEVSETTCRAMSLRSSIHLRSDFQRFSVQLTGTIPEEIYSLTHMISFDVNWCRLTGTLSTRIGQLTKMERFRVSSNDLTGTIPLEVSSLSSIGKNMTRLTRCNVVVFAHF